MTAKLHGLIRLHKFHLDEKRRTLAQMEEMADGIRGQITGLDQRVAQEAALAAQLNNPSVDFASFLDWAKTRKKQLLANLAKVEAQISRARDEIAAAFQDTKKYELAQEERDRKEADRLKRLEGQTLDDIAIERHGRK